jgi:hypothetical protein
LGTTKLTSAPATFPSGSTETFRIKITFSQVIRQSWGLAATWLTFALKQLEVRRLAKRLNGLHDLGLPFQVGESK